MVLFNGADTTDRLVAGGLLALLYARSRCRDGQLARALVTDFAEDALGGYLELQSSEVKTATSVAKRRRLLPMVAPVLSLTAYNWAEVWLRLRHENGLNLADGFPVLPCISKSGFKPSPMSSEHVGAWLRELLIQGGALVDEVSGMTSHSLKCTLLSWSAKYGLPLDIRRFLGHHTKSDDGSLLIYGRDNAAAPLRRLEEVLRAVRMGAFVPDSTRSGRFIEKALRRPIVPISELVDQVTDSAATGYGSARVEPEAMSGILAPLTPALPEPVSEAIVNMSDSSSSSEDEVVPEQSALEVAIGLAALPAEERPEASFGSEWFVHSFLGTVHVLDLDCPGGLTFLCGRRLHDRHFRLSDNSSLDDFSRCWTCFGRD
jgi:hypothetical protein